MKNGTLSQRILRAIRTSKKKGPFISRAMFDHIDGYDQVGRALGKLVEEGYIERVERGVYRPLYVGKQPKLSIPRTWSRPSGVDDETLIATTLAKPTFSDVARLCVFFGVGRVSSVAHEIDLDRRIKNNLEDMLKNINSGIQNAYKPSHRMSAR